MTRPVLVTVVALLTGLLAAVPAALAQTEAMERAPSSMNAAERALTAYHDGERALERGDLAAAAQQFREALSLDETLHAARRGYARILVAAGRPERAQDLLARGLAMTPVDPATARLLVRTAQNNGDPAMAIKALRAMRAQTDAEETRIRAHLADLHRRHGDPAAAAALYAELQRIEPDAARWRLGRATSLDHAGAQAEAAAAWADLIEVETLEPAIRRYAANRLQALRRALRQDGE